MLQWKKYLVIMMKLDETMNQKNQFTRKKKSRPTAKFAGAITQPLNAIKGCVSKCFTHALFPGRISTF